jgi:hypothetical protein
MEPIVALLGQFFGTAMDPFKIILGVGVGALTSGRSVLLWGPVLLAALNEIALHIIDPARQFGFGNVGLSMVACGCFVAMGYWARRFRKSGVTHG